MSAGLNVRCRGSHPAILCNQTSPPALRGDRGLPDRCPKGTPALGLLTRFSFRGWILHGDSSIAFYVYAIDLPWQNKHVKIHTMGRQFSAACPGRRKHDKLNEHAAAHCGRGSLWNSISLRSAANLRQRQNIAKLFKARIESFVIDINGTPA